MLRKVIVLAGVALAALVSTGAQAANLLANGSFEDTTNFSPPYDDTERLEPGSTAMPGWTVTTNEIAWIGPDNPFGFSAEDGSYALDLQSYSDSAPYGGVTQSVATVVGGLYSLNFDLGTYYGSSGITASAGATSASFVAPNYSGFMWTPETLAFTASSTSTLISLLGNQDSTTYIGLDKVRVTCTENCAGSPVSSAPEPADWALMLLGIGGIGYAFSLARKNRKAAGLSDA